MADKKLFSFNQSETNISIAYINANNTSMRYISQLDVDKLCKDNIQIVNTNKAKTTHQGFVVAETTIDAVLFIADYFFKPERPDFVPPKPAKKVANNGVPIKILDEDESNVTHLGLGVDIADGNEKQLYEITFVRAVGLDSIALHNIRKLVEKITSKSAIGVNTIMDLMARDKRPRIVAKFTPKIMRSIFKEAREVGLLISAKKMEGKS